jgi:hypothetical protein
MNRRLLIAATLALLLAAPVIAQVRSNFLLEAKLTTGSGTPARPTSPNVTLHAYGETSAGSGAATIIIEVTNIEAPATATTVDWVTACTISLTLGTTRTGDACTIAAPWRLIRARVSAISGTDASVNVRIGG